MGKKENKKKIKNRKIAMFCTGGVRCEKASSYLKKNGFKNVFQLDGGIISYFQQTKNKNKNWVGECFVFDERVSIKKIYLKEIMINALHAEHQ